MVTYIWETSRTFNEFLLLPNLTTRDHVVQNVELRTPLARFGNGGRSRLYLNLPIVSAIMQAVSDDRLAIALARCGGMSFIYQSQPIEQQVEMVRKVKAFRAGFVESDSNIAPEATIAEARRLSQQTGHSTIAVTEDAGPRGRFLGLLTRRDYPRDRDDGQDQVSACMAPVEELAVGQSDITLERAGELLWVSKQDCLPIVSETGALEHLVFRKDFQSSERDPFQLLDSEQRLVVGAGLNSRDFADRAPALIAAGADALCLDSSDGYSVYQAEALEFLKNRYGDSVIVGAGNVVDAKAFRYLAGAGADFIKIGLGGGATCITREQKGIGRGQASALIEVVQERDRYLQETGVYVPLCSDGGIQYDYQMALALAMGADFLMLGRYFAGFDQSPGARLKVGNNYYKEYWAEGSDRAKNWARYDLGGAPALQFEEGVDGYVPYAGDLYSAVEQTRLKLRSTICNCGALTLTEFHAGARLVNISERSFLDAGASIARKEKESAAP